MMPELRNLELKEGRIPDKNQNWRKRGLLMYRRQGQESVPISSSQVTDLIVWLFCLKSFCLFLLYLVWSPNSFWWILIQAWGALAVCIPPCTLRHPCWAPPAPQSSPGNCHSPLGSPLVGGQCLPGPQMGSVWRRDGTFTVCPWSWWEHLYLGNQQVLRLHMPLDQPREQWSYFHPPVLDGSGCLWLSASQLPLTVQYQLAYFCIDLPHQSSPRAP